MWIDQRIFGLIGGLEDLRRRGAGSAIAPETDLERRYATTAAACIDRSTDSFGGPEEWIGDPVDGFKTPKQRVSEQTTSPVSWVAPDGSVVTAHILRQLDTVSASRDEGIIRQDGRPSGSATVADSETTLEKNVRDRLAERNRSLTVRHVSPTARMVDAVELWHYVTDAMDRANRTFQVATATDRKVVITRHHRVTYRTPVAGDYIPSEVKRPGALSADGATGEDGKAGAITTTQLVDDRERTLSLPVAEDGIRSKRAKLTPSAVRGIRTRSRKGSGWKPDATGTQRVTPATIGRFMAEPRSGSNLAPGHRERRDTSTGCLLVPSVTGVRVVDTATVRTTTSTPTTSTPTTSTPTTSTPTPSDVVSMANASRIANVSRKTVTVWHQSGRLDTVTLANGRRAVTLASLYKVMADRS